MFFPFVMYFIFSFGLYELSDLCWFLETWEAAVITFPSLTLTSVAESCLLSACLPLPWCGHSSRSGPQTLAFSPYQVLRPIHPLLATRLISLTWASDSSYPVVLICAHVLLTPWALNSLWWRGCLLSPLDWRVTQAQRSDVVGLVLEFQLSALHYSSLLLTV